MADDIEGQLVEQARLGDQRALCALLERSGLELQNQIQNQIGTHYRGQFDADDILQVTFMEAFLRVQSLEPGGSGSFAAWLRRIALNNLRDAIRELECDKRPSPGRRVQFTGGGESYVHLIEQIAAVSNTASRVCAGEELRQGVDAALKELPGDYEQALRLFELQGLTGEEVAKRMGRSHGAVRMLLARARERLAEVLGSDSRFFSDSA
ncbi:MAG TPA: sigma-70 family RNA polymerase sigma factor [Phycisphaerae bacterium]|nr:sigma-70 family RNA polymerase sigma factor [Phycisphaerae bacterium]